MFSLILGQIAALDSLGQRSGLTECKAKPLARNCVDRSGSIPDQRNTIAIYRFELARRGSSPALGVDHRARLKAPRQIGKFPESVVQSELRVPRDCSDTDR